MHDPDQRRGQAPTTQRRCDTAIVVDRSPEASELARHEVAEEPGAPQSVNALLREALLFIDERGPVIEERGAKLAGSLYSALFARRVDGRAAAWCGGVALVASVVLLAHPAEE